MHCKDENMKHLNVYFVSHMADGELQLKKERERRAADDASLLSSLFVCVFLCTLDPPVLSLAAAVGSGVRTS